MTHVCLRLFWGKMIDQAYGTKSGRRRAFRTAYYLSAKYFWYNQRTFAYLIQYTVIFCPCNEWLRINEINIFTRLVHPMDVIKGDSRRAIMSRRQNNKLETKYQRDWRERYIVQRLCCLPSKTFAIGARGPKSMFITYKIGRFITCHVLRRRVHSKICSGVYLSWTGAITSVL